MTDPDEIPAEPAHRHPQEAMDGLARMGIDPTTLGLPPASTSGDADKPAGGPAAEPAGEPAGGEPEGGEPTAVLDRAIDDDHAPFQAPVRHLNDTAHHTFHPDEPDSPDGDPGTQPTAPVVAPTGARRAVAAFGAGLLTARSARRIHDEQELVARVRSPQREHQVVVFVAGKGGVGTTTTAAGVALAMATLRDDHVALIDTQAGTDSLQWWLAESISSAPPGLDHMQDERYSSLQLSNGLDVIDGAPWQAPAAPADLTATIEDLRRAHTFTLVDLGDDVGPTAHQMLAASTRVVVVTAADRHAARATQLMLSRIHQAQPARLADAVVAVVCLVRGQYRRVVREVRADLGSHASLVVPVPHEPALSATDHFDLSRLHAQSREAYLRVAAALAGPPALSPVIRPEVPAPLWAT